MPEEQNKRNSTFAPKHTNLMSIPELASRCGVSTKTAWRWVSQRRISFYRLNRRVVVSEFQLQQFLCKLEVRAIDAEKAAKRILGEF